MGPDPLNDPRKVIRLLKRSLENLEGGIEKWMVLSEEKVRLERIVRNREKRERRR